ncbi:restriction endonuclease subunit S [Flavobacterium sp. UBA4197]|uniref:restriction endonuclease subunit S n=1 Tax=Flavobacterium sp. UBA4197 TaxID=1946546 RepID=UPI00257CBE97|nr:restriction endonuclease subunit S [Flavobacterium sp. UBA4197]
MYNLPAHTNPNKIFIINRSELVDRWDGDMVLYNKILHNFKYNIVSLKSLLIKNPQYGANESGVTRASFLEPRYVRITDIDEYGLLKNEIGVTAQNIESRFILDNDDILFARSGNTVGKAYIHKKDTVNYDCFFAGYMIRFVVDKSKILPDYLFAYTQLGAYKNWVKAIQRTAGQPNINAEEYKSLQIPLPGINIQKDIASIFQSAYTQKQEKEAEAQQLLNSIDTYLLSELGITLPEKDNSLKSRMFTAQFSKMVGGRLDPLFYNSDLSLFELGKYLSKPLRDIVKAFKSGIGAGKQDQTLDGNGLIQIRPTNIDEKGNLIFTKNVYLPFHFRGDKLKYDDVLFNNTNSQDLVGKTAIVKTNEELFYSNHITVLKANLEQLVPDYLHSILNLFQKEKIFYSLCTNWNNQSGIGIDLLKNLRIPVPPIEKQNEIANHIKGIQNQAKVLQQEAEAILNDAKAEIEQMILG